MDVVLITREGCPRGRQIQRMLHQLSIPYRLQVPDRLDGFDPGADEEPVLLIDGRVRFRRLPRMEELRSCFAPARIASRWWGGSARAARDA